ncbi:MAG: helix-turn-helix transcriptional regulator [Myxococcales bacterium]|nr:helix-turn-helix transcriptional regulator [Myxococcales bacterium]
MPSKNHRAGLYPALLKHWRLKRGMSQLDFALAADVSSRHVSFLETGRSSPSSEMVRRLAAVLDVPLRHVNAMLEAAGHEAHFGSSDPMEAMTSFA